MPGAYGFASWVERHAGALIVASAAAGITAAILTPKIFAKPKPGGVRSPPPTLLRGDAARRGLADRGCVNCRDVVTETNHRAFVNDAAYQQMRDQGYVGYSYGPLGRYPGAKGPAPAVPVYGSYRGSSRIVWPDERGPRNYRVPVQSVANRESPAIWNRQLTKMAVPNPRDADVNFAFRARGAVNESPVGQEPGGFYRDPVSLANTVDIQTQDYPGGEGGYNLSVGNLPPGAEGNLSAPVTYQDINQHGGIASADAPYPPAPYLSMGGGGYRGQSARWVVAQEIAARYGPKRTIQSVATAQEGRAQAEAGLSDRGFADYSDFYSDQGETVGFPWWSPSGRTGPLGNSRMSLDDSGGGYVSPSAYRGAREGTLRVPEGGYAPLVENRVVPGYPSIERDASLENTIDIQTQDFPGGIGGYNLSVNNLPLSADGNLSAPVDTQQLSPAGGIAGWDEPDEPRLRPWLSQHARMGA